MVQTIKINYWNSQLDIGMVNWKEVYQLQPVIQQLRLEVERGRLVYRAKGLAKRNSYQ